MQVDLTDTGSIPESGSSPEESMAMHSSILAWRIPWTEDHFHQEAFEFLFTFCYKGGVICISEVIDISPGNLDSSLCFFQSSVSHDVLCIEVK